MAAFSTGLNLFIYCVESTVKLKLLLEQLEFLCREPLSGLTWSFGATKMLDSSELQ